MQVRIIIIGTELQVMVDGDDVDFETAKRVTQAVSADLRARGIPLTQTSDIEQHRAGGLSHAHIVTPASQQHDHDHHDH